MSSCKCIGPACDALKRCGSFKGPSSSRYSRIKEVISARLPRNSAYTGIPYAVRSETWRLTSALHEQWGGVDQRDQRFQCRPCGVRPLSCSSTAATRTGVLFCPASAHHRRERALPPHLIRSMIRPIIRCRYNPPVLQSLQWPTPLTATYWVHRDSQVNRL